jgi:hypothetical protein
MFLLVTGCFWGGRSVEIVPQYRTLYRPTGVVYALVAAGPDLTGYRPAILA